MTLQYRLLTLDFLLRTTGIACFTLFIAAIYEVTGKPSDIGMISVATVGPALLMTLYAGKYTEVLSPLGVLKWASTFRLFLFIIAALSVPRSGMLLGVAALQSLIHQMTITAKMSLDAQTIASDQRRAYLAQKNILASIAIISGPPIGGVLVSFFGISMAVAFMALMNLAIVSLLFTFPSSIVTDGPQFQNQENASAIESLAHLLSLPLTAAIVIVFCVVAIILEVQAPLLFPFVREVYQSGSHFTGLLLGLAGIGGILGSLCAQRFPKIFTEKMIPWLVMTDGVLFLIFTLLRSPLPASILFISLGVMGAATLIVVEGAIQRDVNRIHQPFVFALMQFSGGAGGACLGIMAGFLVESHGAKVVLSGAAISEILAGAVMIIVLIYSKSGFQTAKDLGHD